MDEEYILLKQLYELAVSLFPSCLKSVPTQFISEEMYFTAAKAGHPEVIPLHSLTPELCALAIRAKPKCIKYLSSLVDPKSPTTYSFLTLNYVYLRQIKIFLL